MLCILLDIVFFCIFYCTALRAQVQLTDRELEAVRMSSMARILCDNTEVMVIMTLFINEDHGQDVFMIYDVI